MLYKLLKWLLSLFTRKHKKPARTCAMQAVDPFVKCRARLIARMEEEHRERNIHLRPTTCPNRMVIEVDDFIQAFLLFVHFANIRQVQSHTAAGTIRYTSQQPGNLTLQLTDQSAHPRQLGRLRLNDIPATDRQFSISIVKSTTKTTRI